MMSSRGDGRITHAEEKDEREGGDEKDGDFFCDECVPNRRNGVEREKRVLKGGWKGAADWYGGNAACVTGYFTFAW